MAPEVVVCAELVEVETTTVLEDVVTTLPILAGPPANAAEKGNGGVNDARREGDSSTGLPGVVAAVAELDEEVVGAAEPLRETVKL